MLLSIPPFFFLLFEGDLIAEDVPPPPLEEDEYLEAYLCRFEIFLNSSDASDSEENAIPIMQSSEGKVWKKVRSW